MICVSLGLLMATATGQSPPRQPGTNASPAADVEHSTPPAAIFEALCKALQDNYPMLELAGLSGDQWVPEYRAKVANATSRAAAFEIMDELVCRLNDYHTHLSWPEQPRLASPPVRVEPVLTSANLPPDYGLWGMMRPPQELPPLDGVSIAVVEADPACDLKVGDEIISVGGIPARTLLERTWRHSVCSSAAGKLRAAAGQMLLGAARTDLKVIVQRHRPEGDVEAMVAVPRSDGPSEEVVSSREVEGVPAIRITQWVNPPGENLVERFDKALEGARNRPGLIIDVRGNGGGEDKLASQVVGRFLSRAVIASISFHRKVPSLDFERTVEWTQPRGPWRYKGRVAVLTDEGCMSACEHFVSGMIEAGALTCGTPTSGACGWIRMVELPGGARLSVSRTFPLHGGIPSPQLGMAPYIWAPRKLADLRAGRDTALRAALAWLNSSDPLPPRLQPLSPLSR
jgi:C-terminal processing protease CtpA/Prc